jgi:hypothetical protein
MLGVPHPDLVLVDQHLDTVVERDRGAGPPPCPVGYTRGSHVNILVRLNIHGQAQCLAINRTSSGQIHPSLKDEIIGVLIAKGIHFPGPETK